MRHNPISESTVFEPFKYSEGSSFCSVFRIIDRDSEIKFVSSEGYRK